MTITLQIMCDGIACGSPLSESAARAWLEFVQHVAPETAKAMAMALRQPIVNPSDANAILRAITSYTA